jgi:hypothetical protein
MTIASDKLVLGAALVSSIASSIGLAAHIRDQVRPLRNDRLSSEDHGRGRASSFAAVG